MDRLVAQLTNAIAFEMFKDDGREVTRTEGGVETISCTPEETDRARRAAERVLNEMGAL
jgi:hypothetical protein